MKQSPEATEYFYVRAPEGNGYTTPEAMQRIDDDIFSMGAWLNHVRPGGTTPDALPVPESDGSWRVETLDPAVGNIVRQIIARHYGLQIIEPGEATSVSKPEENPEASDKVSDVAPEGGAISLEEQQTESAAQIKSLPFREEGDAALLSRAEKLITDCSAFEFCRLADAALNNPGSVTVNYRALAEAMVTQAGKVMPGCVVLLTVLAHQEGQSADLDSRFPKVKSEAALLVRSLKTNHQLANYYPGVCAFFQ